MSYDKVFCKSHIKVRCDFIDKACSTIDMNFQQTDFDNVDQKNAYQEVVNTMKTRLTTLKYQLESYKFE